jgi:CheY-like chemotaxis protein
MTESAHDPLSRLAVSGGGIDKAATGMTVLLAEDDQDIRDVVQEVLEERGYDVIPARTGRQALDFLTIDEARPDVVILDLMMPIMTGWQVLEEIRQRPDLLKIPVIVLTAVSQDMPTGVTAVLRKPFNIDDLLTLLAQSRPS